MSAPVWTYAQNGSKIVLPVGPTNGTAQPVEFITIDNGTAAVLALAGPDGTQYALIPAYQSRPFTVADWSTFQLSNFGGQVLQATDILVIQAFPFAEASGWTPSSYGPAAWGAGAVGGTLVNVNSGDQFMASQVQQLINLLTGVMTAQAVTLGNTIDVKGATTLEGTIDVKKAATLEGIITANKNANLSSIVLDQSQAYAVFRLKDAGGGGKSFVEGDVVSGQMEIYANNQATVLLTLDNAGNLTIKAQVACSDELAINGGLNHPYSFFTLTDSGGGKKRFVEGDLHSGQAEIYATDLSTPLYSWDNSGNFKAKQSIANVQGGYAGSLAGSDQTVTFPTAYTGTPAVVLSVGQSGDVAANLRACALISVNTSGFTFNVRDVSTNNRVAIEVGWLATGPMAIT